MAFDKVAVTAMALAGLTNFFMAAMAAIDPNCDYYQEMTLGQTYYLYNKEYPNNYPPNTSCRWVARSPANTRIILSCEDIQIPPTSSCTGDYLGVSLSGDPNFSDVRKYCGTGTASLVSDANQLAVGLFSTWYSSGGKYLCTVTAIVSENQTTTTPTPPQCDCGWRQERRIVGGHETGVNEYPAMAALIEISVRDVTCGASIIASKYAITAAHCIRQPPSSYGLLVGDHDISTGTDTDASALYAINRFIIHEAFNNRTLENDICIIQTTNKMVFSTDVGPICLPFRYTSESFEGATVVVLGWGTVEFLGPKSDVLLAASLQVVSNAQCRQELPQNVVTQNSICTYAPGKDACQSDSGGPLYLYDGNIRRLIQVGIVSYGLACATETPGVNTRVTSYLSWIVSKTTDATYCIK